MLRKLLFAMLLSTSTLPISALPARAEYCEIFYDQYGERSNCPFPSKGGIFQNAEWEVTIAPNLSDGFEYEYKGLNREKGDSIRLGLSNEIFGTTQRRQFIFHNDNYRYIVTIRPSEPNIIRLEVHQGSKVILNQLLYKVGGPDAARQQIFGW